MNTQVKTLAVLVAVATSCLGRGAEACSVQNMANWSAQQSESATQFDAAFANYVGAQRRPSIIIIGRQGIVGLWKFTFVAEGNSPPGPPDGFVIDSGFQTWHIDNTELMNSSRPAATGDFCMGIWKQQGHTYTLNHFALAWNAPGTTPSDFAGIANIRENVTLSHDGDSFSGTATLDQYMPDGVTVAAHLIGTIVGTRITVDSAVSGD